MRMMLSRRLALGGMLAMPALFAVGSRAPAKESNSTLSELTELELRHPGRVCVSILEMGTGRRIEHRADEQMLMCSTFKAMAAAHILKRVDEKREALDRRVVFSQHDLVPSSPGTEGRSGEPGMTIAELCDAAITLSDNTAGNVLLASSGGPSGLTGFLRSIGDDISRLDRIETDLNYHDGVDDLRDTTSAAAMVDNLRKLVFGNVLSPTSRSQLVSWLVNNKTGNARIRAGLPRDCVVGDKTGVNGDKHGNLNDIAILWPADRPPLIVAAFCEIPGISAGDRNAVIAEIGRIALQV